MDLLCLSFNSSSFFSSSFSLLSTSFFLSSNRSNCYRMSVSLVTHLLVVHGTIGLILNLHSQTRFPSAILQEKSRNPCFARIIVALDRLLSPQRWLPFCSSLFLKLLTYLHCDMHAVYLIRCFVIVCSEGS